MTKLSRSLGSCCYFLVQPAQPNCAAEAIRPTEQPRKQAPRAGLGSPQWRSAYPVAVPFSLKNSAAGQPQPPLARSTQRPPRPAARADLSPAQPPPTVYRARHGWRWQAGALRALAADNGVLEHFPGGIHFVSLGPDAWKKGVIHLLQEAVEASGGRIVAASIRRVSTGLGNP